VERLYFKNIKANLNKFAQFAKQQTPIEQQVGYQQSNQHPSSKL